MPNLDFALGTFALPVWAAGAAVALFIVIGVLTLTRAGASLAALARKRGAEGTRCSDRLATRRGCSSRLDQ